MYLYIKFIFIHNACMYVHIYTILYFSLLKSFGKFVLSRCIMLCLFAKTEK